MINLGKGMTAAIQEMLTFKLQAIFGSTCIHAGTLVYNLYAIHQQEVDAAAHLANGGQELKVGLRG